MLAVNVTLALFALASLPRRGSSFSKMMPLVYIGSCVQCGCVLRLGIGSESFLRKVPAFNTPPYLRIGKVLHTRKP